MSTSKYDCAVFRRLSANAIKFDMVKKLASIVLVKSGFGPNFVTAATCAPWSFVNLVIFQQVSMDSMQLLQNIILEGFLAGVVDGVDGINK